MAESTFQPRKIGGEKCVNHEHEINFVTKYYICLQNMIFVCLYLMIEHDWEKIGSAVSKQSGNLMGSAFSA